MGVKTLCTLLVGAGLVVTLGGCGGDPNRPKLGKVSGKVTYNGAPVSSGEVVFTPVSGKGGETGQGARGSIGSDGRYEMTTFDTGDGAIYGQHVVTVVVREKGAENLGKPKADGTFDYKLPKAVTPSKYASAEKSHLRCTVDSGSKTFDIDLKD